MTVHGELLNLCPVLDSPIALGSLSLTQGCTPFETLSTHSSFRPPVFFQVFDPHHHLEALPAHPFSFLP